MPADRWPHFAVIVMPVLPRENVVEFVPNGCVEQTTLHPSDVEIDLNGADKVLQGFVMMTCLELALTAQLICLSDHRLVCSDNGSIAQLLGVPACTKTELNQPNDDRCQIQGQRGSPGTEVCALSSRSRISFGNGQYLAT